MCLKNLGRIVRRNNNLLIKMYLYLRLYYATFHSPQDICRIKRGEKEKIRKKGKGKNCIIFMKFTWNEHIFFY